MAEATASNLALQGALDELQNKLVILHESSSTAQSKLAQQYAASQAENIVLSKQVAKLRESALETSERRLVFQSCAAAV